MYNIEAHEPSEEFASCLQAAARHIQQQVQGQVSWLKADLNPPFLEHLSFRLGNQLFFVRLEDVDGKLEVPGNPNGLLRIADGCKGHACLMPMRRNHDGWAPDLPDWGFLQLRTGRPINPIALVSDELIEMTDWELQDFAVQVVRNHLAERGAKQMSCQGNPSVNPSIWFVRDDGLEWVVVRAVRYPQLEAELPTDWLAIVESCSRKGATGYFASVSFANADDAFDASGTIPPTPLWRGHGMYIRFEGLAAVSL